MKLYLETKGGVEYEIQVADGASLDEIKEEVEKLLAIPVSDQILIFGGDILDDDRYFENGSRLFLDFAPNATPVYVCIKMPPPYKSFPMKVNVYETIERLKQFIQEEAETNPMWQMVIKREIGVELPDEAALIECQNSLYPDVTVVFRPPPREVALDLPKEDLWPPPQGTVALKLRYVDGPRMAVHARADPNATIAEVKERIMKTAGKSSAMWRVVMWRKDGVELGDGRRVGEYADITLVGEEYSYSWKRLKARVEFRKRMHLVVELPEPKLPTFLNDFCFEDTIRRVKEALHEAEGFPMERMVIRHEDGDELADHKMLLECRTSLHTLLKLQLLDPMIVS